MSADFLPAGAILPFAADDTTKLEALGWTLCDGDQFSKDTYPELFAIIGYINGGQNGLFSVPDLRGRFIRGSSSSRAAGQVAPFTTSTNFSVSIEHIPGDYWSENKGAVGPASRNMVDWNGGSNTFDVQGGDSETRPVNVYMNFIIKLKNGASVPPGSLAPYAGADTSSDTPLNPWLACDGNKYGTANMKDLYSVIGDRFSYSPTANRFAVPIIDGQFIRGVDLGAGRDPDTKTRSAAPDGTQGSVVGTLQQYATSAKGLSVTISHYPPNSSNEVYPTLGHDNLHDSGRNDGQSWNYGSAKETRPTNAYVTYYIKSKTTPNSSDFPIGGIIAVPGPGKLDPKFWAPCDGSVVSVGNNALYQALLNAWGAPDDKSFQLPDLRDQFLRATDNNAATNPDPWGDPDRTGRAASGKGGVTKGTGSKQAFATGRPKNNFYIPISVPNDVNANAAGGTGYTISEFNRSVTTWAATGGQAETAPVNVAVTFYIKIASA